MGVQSGTAVEVKLSERRRDSVWQLIEYYLLLKRKRYQVRVLRWHLFYVKKHANDRDLGDPEASLTHFADSVREVIGGWAATQGTTLQFTREPKGSEFE